MSDIFAETRDGIATVTFNRPQRRNALTWEMYEALDEALRAAHGDDGVRVVLFHGGPDAFTAGNDLEDFIRRPPLGDDTPVFRFLHSVATATKPLVAAVNGPAVGLGTTLLFHCDLVYAAHDARFQMPFTSLGLVPEFASSYLLPLIAGYQRAAEMLLLGESFDAAKAYEMGFVTRVVAAADTLATATAAAARLAALPARSVQGARALMKGAHRSAVENQLRLEGDLFRAMLTEPAAREAFAAFLEKRKPDFSRK